MKIHKTLYLLVSFICFMCAVVILCKRFGEEQPPAEAVVEASPTVEVVGVQAEEAGTPTVVAQDKGITNNTLVLDFQDFELKLSNRK